MNFAWQRLARPTVATQVHQFSHPVVFALVAFAADLAAITGASVLAGLAYHLAVYGNEGPLLLYLRTGIVVALFFTLPYLFQEKYRLTSFLTGDQRLASLFLIWNYAFLGMFAVDFLTRSSEMISRGSIIVFYFAGFILIALLRRALTRYVQQGCQSGRISAREVMLVGTSERIRDFLRRHEPSNHGLRIAHSILLDAHFDLGEREGDAQELDRTLEGALSLLRQDRIDDVILLLPWSRRALIDRCISHFMNSSVSIHLGPQPILDRFMDAHLTRLGSINTLTIVRPPLSSFEVAMKRGFDFLAAGFGLLLLSPLLLVCALLIRLDSPGPALFRQKRYGFNFEPFQILKFRTMTVMEDGADVKQAVKNDPRITRIGHFLRKWNIDELPQLINVLKGDMSLVGPRPHALAHDHEFAEKIAQYARRMNVQPGITGLAQVNGFRGPTDTDEKIMKRVECDLNYIDNWSMALDLRIILKTVFSKTAYRNAH